MRNWNEVDLLQVDLASPVGGGPCTGCTRRSSGVRVASGRKVLRDGFAWLRRTLWQPRRPRNRRQVYAPVPRGPLDLIFGGRA